MGVSISEIIPRKEIELHQLKGKTIAIDAFNTLYQFLTTIRQPDGTPLMDSEGNITSHLSGLFYRTISLIQEGITPIYVFDGKPPELKREELNRRAEQKRRAQEKHEIAIEEGDSTTAGKYAGRFVTVNDKIIAESKELLRNMGVGYVQAPSEGEAEASILAKKGKVWGAASQDYDALLYGTPHLIRNLTLARRRKTATGLYIDVAIEHIEFQNVLNQLQIDKDQLICLAILVGTDYNPGGIKGIGQKKALEIVQQYEYPIQIFEHIEKHETYELTFDWKEIFKQFHEYESTEEEIETNTLNEEGLKEFLLKYEFSQNRIDSGIEKIKAAKEQQKQKGLTDYF